MNHCLWTFAAAMLALAGAQAQVPKSGPWQMQHSTTRAALRGIHAVGGGVAWASGTNGTVLRTEDDGYMWQSCAMPPGVEKLDFRGIWAWDADTAIVMSSGPGDLSRIYKTTDGCSHWKLMFTNPDAASGSGFWDDILFLDRNRGIVIGDPAHIDHEATPSAFRIRVTSDGGKTWVPVVAPTLPKPGESIYPLPQEGIFAASNSSVAISDGHIWIGTSGPRVIGRELGPFQVALCAGAIDPFSKSCGIPWEGWQSAKVPLASGNEASGVFSLAFRDLQHGMAVGGDYQRPNDAGGAAAWTDDGGEHWTAAAKPPHGYRSAVAWDAADKAWIAAGTNGSDVSRDGGRTWHPLDNGNWNALSLPWIVGPQGRIAKLVSLK